MTLRIAELCAGYGGLGLAVERLGWPVELAWYAEYEPPTSTNPTPSQAAAKVMTHHHPGVPNVGDITAADWSTVEPVDIMLAGYPCQSFSHAGLRKGFDDERAVWPSVAGAVRHLRPRLVLLENVSGHVVRGLSRVIGDLASIGYVGSWGCLRASDLGAPHQRERVFVYAFPAGDLPGDVDGRVALLPTPRATDGTKGGPNQRGSSGDLMLPSVVQSLLPTPTPTPTPTANLGRGAGAPSTETAADRFARGRRFLDDAVALFPTPTPTAADGSGGPGQGSTMEGSPSLRTVASALLPTPTPTPTSRDATRGAGWTDEEGRPLSETVMRLLPTPTVADSRGSRNATAGRTGTGHHDGWTLCDVAYADRWGRYGAAIRRWEGITGREAPEPTEPGVRGGPRLSPRFVEFLMGLPAGYVTDLIDHHDPRRRISRNDALRVLGNGVVPIQAAAAYRALAAVTS